MLSRMQSKSRPRNRFVPQAERLENRRLLAINIIEEFRPFEFEFEGTFNGSATIVGSPNYVVSFSGETSGEGRIEYTSPILGAGELSGEVTGIWNDNADDSGTFVGAGEAEVTENDGFVAASRVLGQGSSSSGLAGGIDLTGLAPADANAVVDLLTSQAFATWDLDLSSLIGSPASSQGVAVVGLTPALTDATDLRPVSGAFTSSGGVEFSVEATGQLVPTGDRSAPVASVRLLWASGPSSLDAIGPATGDEAPMHWNTGQVHAEVADLTPAPPEATHLLIVADPDEILPEGNEQNNVLALALPTAQTGKITGGGTLDPGRQNFGFVINTSLKDGVPTFQGNLQFNDQELGIRLHSTSLDTLQVADDGSWTFTGEAKVNGVTGYRFTVIVRDGGEPGRGSDTFQLIVEGPGGFSYDSDEVASNGGQLRGGNIQFHDSPGKKRR